ncbi:protein containing DNA topoisomerase, type IIA, subunit A or, partial [mine drainage metagenome]
MYKKYSISTSRINGKVLRVEQISAAVLEHAGYHHGARNLDDVIVGIAQDFVGSNNVRLITKSGQFGSRSAGGKDAAQSRYGHTKPEKILPYLIREEDDPLLTYKIDENEHVEPEIYYPIIPWVLINGAYGIGTAWSTFIPNYDFKDILNYLRARIQGKQLSPLTPKYRGYKGNC